MKSLNPFRILAIIIAFIFSSGLSAQETTVSIKVKKDGKVVKDTTYSFENEEQAENALNIMEVMCTGDEKVMEIHKTMSESNTGNTKKMVFISEDGKTTLIEESSGDSLVWNTEGETYHIFINEEREGDPDGENTVKTKEVKVVISSDEGSEWSVKEGDDMKVDSEKVKK